MSAIDQQGRPEPEPAADELATLLGFLDFQRATFDWKCHGLDHDGFTATVGASSMTLGGMMNHLALVEDAWFVRWLLDKEHSPPWDAVDWEADRDWEWRTAADEAPDALRARWQASVDRSRLNVEQALSDGRGLDQLAERRSGSGFCPSLRWILCHMIEEYARHNGHADLLRESIDGETGE